MGGLTVTQKSQDLQNQVMDCRLKHLRNAVGSFEKHVSESRGNLAFMRNAVAKLANELFAGSSRAGITEIEPAINNSQPSLEFHRKFNAVKDGVEQYAASVGKITEECKEVRLLCEKGFPAFLGTQSQQLARGRPSRGTSWFGKRCSSSEIVNGFKSRVVAQLKRVVDNLRHTKSKSTNDIGPVTLIKDLCALRKEWRESNQPGLQTPQENVRRANEEFARLAREPFLNTSWSNAQPDTEELFARLAPPAQEPVSQESRLSSTSNVPQFAALQRQPSNFRMNPVFDEGTPDSSLGGAESGRSETVPLSALADRNGNPFQGVGQKELDALNALESEQPSSRVIFRQLPAVRVTGVRKRQTPSAVPAQRLMHRHLREKLKGIKDTLNHKEASLGVDMRERDPKTGKWKSDEASITRFDSLMDEVKQLQETLQNQLAALEKPSMNSRGN
ncbi:MAG: hypothetical protein HC848_09610 [Limnobacter sp.]|nr:hypothetical protein [Limnobacter sp.]